MLIRPKLRLVTDKKFGVADVNSPCNGLTGFGVDAELVKDFWNNFSELQREVVEGLELEDERHDGVPCDGLILRRRLRDGLADLLRGSCEAKLFICACSRHLTLQLRPIIIRDLD